MKEENDKITPQYYYSEEEFDLVSDYIDQQFGAYDFVMHEKVSPDIHCDICIVPPTEVQPYYILVTMGAGAYKMKVPKELESVACGRAEYVIWLPKDWNIRSTKEEDYWPIRMLKQIARYPIQSGEWIGFGDTFQSNEDGSPVAENTRFNSCFLLGALDKKDELVQPLQLNNSGKKVEFLQLFPLYPEELDYTYEHSVDELMDKFDEYESLVVDIHRKNYCE